MTTTSLADRRVETAYAAALAPVTSARAVGAIVVCAVLAYAAALGGTFVYDDFHSVRDNEALRSLVNVPAFFTDPSMFSAAGARMYRPLLLVSFAIDHALGGGAVVAFKVTDVLLHAACAALVYSVARRLRADRTAALFAGLLFAVHPLASEAVNSVASRSDQLLALAVLLAIRLHFAALAGSRLAVLGIAVATVIGCGAKETGVVVPAVLVVLEFVRGVRRRPALLGMLARVGPSIVVAVAYLLVRRELLGVATVAVPALTGGADPTLGAGRDLVTQWTAMGGVLPRLLAQTLVPIGLSADPQVRLDAAPFDPWVVAGWLLVFAATVAGLAAPRRRPGAFVGTCVAWAIALPWVAIPLNSPANEHRFYGVLAALTIVIGTTMPAVWLRVRSGRAALVLVLGVFGTLATQRSLLHRDPRLLWQDTLARRPASVAALRGLAQAHQDDAKQALLAGDAPRAYAEIRLAIDYAYRALGLAPRDVEVLKGLVRFHLALPPDLGQPMLAVVHAEQLAAMRPKDPFGRIQLSRALAAAGVATGRRARFEEADAVAMSILEIAAPKGLVYRVAAEAWTAAGEPERALARLDEAIARGFDHWSVRLDRAAVLLDLGRRDEAVQEAQRVLSQAPFEPRALQLVERAHAMPPR